VKVVVFGGSGFVGSHVCDALSEQGHETTVADIEQSSYLRSDQRFEAVDIQDAARVNEIVAGHEVVYNFAGLADIAESRHRAVETARVNVVGNAHLLEAARLAGARRYVFASTIYVYSEAGSFYRASKQASELYVEEYRREFGLPYTILRYGTLYGRRSNEKNAVHSYLRQALETRRIVAEGNLEQIREYIHVEDAARLSVEILDDGFANEQVILAGEQRMRLRDLLTLIQEIVGPDVSIDVHPFDHEDPEAVKSGHYTITPYVFRPKVARKLSDRRTMDIGQGLLDCLQEIHERDLEQQTVERR
jgi:UDP-glucose 4-epimerase